MGKKASGYHRIYTLFHRLSLCDEITLSKREEGFRLQCSNPKVPLGEKNLITRAYRLLQAECSSLGGVDVRLTKRIPMGAGLGGGSANAAMFLLGMKKMYRIPLKQKDLVRIGKTLGADVPFFLYEVRLAVGSDRGDRVRVLPTGPKHQFLLALSKKGLSTAEVFSEVKKEPKAPSLTKVSRAVTMLCEFLAEKNYVQAATLFQNDLEVPAFRLRPSLLKIVDAFKKLDVSCVQMSGSGTTIFGIVSNPQKAERIRKKLERQFPSKEFVLCHSF